MEFVNGRDLGGLLSQPSDFRDKQKYREIFQLKYRKIQGNTGKTRNRKQCSLCHNVIGRQLNVGLKCRVTNFHLSLLLTLAIRHFKLT